jgi:hypothetical protein
LTVKQGIEDADKNAKDDTRGLFSMNFTGISPNEKSSTGKRRKGKSPLTSYLGNETTMTIKKTVAQSFVLGSSLWIKVSLYESVSRYPRLKYSLSNVIAGRLLCGFIFSDNPYAKAYQKYQTKYHSRAENA